MTCEEARPLLDAYIDGELELMLSFDIERHVRGCAACARAVGNIRALSGELSAGAAYYSAPPALAARVRAAIRNEQRAQGRALLPLVRFNFRWVAGAAALLMAAIVGSAVLVPRPSPDDAIARAVVADHVRSLMENHLTDVLSSDQHTVKPWFDGRVDFAPPVEDFAARGFPLVGGRLDYLSDRAVAAVIYRRRKHVINLFVWPTPGARDTAMTTGVRQGYNLVHWTRAGLTYWVVSNLNGAELREFSEMVLARG
ncbi:MAG TPA: anti-sigma factor [Candidatus Binataceae bacterium]|nr:anti-sigma factor [Candidatus Binataceae bacterium]